MINFPQAQISNSVPHLAAGVLLTPLPCALITLNYVVLILQQITAVEIQFYSIKYCISYFRSDSIWYSMWFNLNRDLLRLIAG